MSAYTNPLTPNLQTTGPAARSSVVTRTHRVVRERARVLKAERTRNRALLLPLIIASSLVLILVSAFWLMFDEYEAVATGIPDARFHLPLLLLWFLPVTGALLIVALLRRFRASSSGHQEPR